MTHLFDRRSCFPLSHLFAKDSCSGLVFIMSLIVVVCCSQSQAHALCKRCENNQLASLKDYWLGMTTHVSFRQFLHNVLHALSSFKDLEHVYHQLHRLIRRYDDCLLTCEIPFTKRGDVIDIEAHKFLIKLRHPQSDAGRWSKRGRRK